VSEPALTLADLQKRTAALLAPVAHPRVLVPLAVLEEAGELARLVLEHEGYGQPLDPAKLGGELADLILALSELATRYQVDLDAACREKLADVATRVPRWTEKYGPALEKARRRLDPGT
jgi:NTP pyrophosphatase (non-canonical NTP hydrolase)